MEIRNKAMEELRTLLDGVRGIIDTTVGQAQKVNDSLRHLLGTPEVGKILLKNADIILDYMKVSYILLVLSRASLRGSIDELYKAVLKVSLKWREEDLPTEIGQAHDLLKAIIEREGKGNG